MPELETAGADRPMVVDAPVRVVWEAYWVLLPDENTYRSSVADSSHARDAPVVPSHSAVAAMPMLPDAPARAMEWAFPAPLCATLGLPARLYPSAAGKRRKAALCTHAPLGAPMVTATLEPPLDAVAAQI